MADSLKAATKKSLYEANVSKLDGIGSKASDFLQEGSLSVIENVLGDFIERVHTNINNEQGLVVTGKISELSIKGENGAVNVVGNKWLIYQDRGVNGSVIKKYNTSHSYTSKMPPVSVFIDWIKQKNIHLINNEDYKGKPSPFKELTEEEQIESAAWGMATKVFQEGFKPRNIFSKEIPQLIKDLAKEIANIGVQSIIQGFDVKPTAKRVIIPK